MKWTSAISAAPLRLSVFATPAISVDRPRRDTFGPVTAAGTGARQDVLPLSMREALAAQARANRKAHRPVKATYSAAREITHGILARGVR